MSFRLVDLFEKASYFFKTLSAVDTVYQDKQIAYSST